ncbi:hypothetical protein DH2020_034535 [Rehmannia glutinosa]|uniref:Cytochrome P450 protein n=1 Tax=Rehmannia glutinosa TaxID=99300 RepID=A0ABR0V930_REHGL
MYFLYPQTIMFISIFSLIIFYIFNLRRKTTTYGFKTYPLVGSLPEFLLNRHRFFDWTTTVLAGCPSNTAYLRLPGNVEGFITANPLVVEHMLKSNFDNYPKGPRSKNLLQDFLGTGIFNADGDDWRSQRKMASHELNTKSFKNFVLESVGFELRGRLIGILDGAAESGRVVDFQNILERLAFDNICKVALNVDPGCLEGDGTVSVDLMQAFDDAAVLSSGRFMSAVPGLYKIKKFFNLGSEKKLRKSIAIVHDFADKIVRARIMEGNSDQKKDEDLLSRFIGSNYTTQNNINSSPEFLRDIVISFILAGRDTTSSALSWFFWLLSSRPDVEERILNELKNIRRRQNKKSIHDIFSLDELREMHYLQAAISEAMRLYPPLPINTKSCKKNDVLPDGSFVGKNWFLSYNAQESGFKFAVFNAGPRICLGKEMAYIQMKSIAALVLQRFELDVVLESGSRPEYLLSFTLRMKDGLPVRVKRRSIVV